MTHIRTAAMVGAALLASPLLSQSNDMRPVVIGLDGPEFDACGALGQVSNLNPRGDNYLSVRARPSTAGRELDRLGPNAEVWLCETSEDGRWHGIVYGYDADGNIWDCQALGLEARPRAYTGPCRSGWVHGDYILVIAG